MKNMLTTLLISLFFFTGFCQNAMYEIRAAESRPLTNEALNKAKTLADFIPGYPEHWISSYVSVEILASYNGKLSKATAPDDILTTEQKNILNTSEPGAVVVVNVNYKYNNVATNTIENNQINVSMTVVPETEAEYISGREEMNKYLKKKVSDKISATASKKLQNGTVVFTVNAEGNVMNVKMSKASGDPTADKLVVDGISKMPKWKPAENSKGVKVNQEFVFNVGSRGC